MSKEPTYSLGAVARLTGLSPHVLRAWERRYGAVKPLRTPGGTRRYRESDVARLRQLRAAVQAGHSISEVANAPAEELERRLELSPALPAPSLAPLLAAIEQLDAPTTEQLLGAQLAALGPIRFVRTVASPLLNVIGALVWGIGLTLLGYFLGQFEIIQKLLEPIFILIVVLSVAPMFWEWYKRRRRAKAAGDAADGSPVGGSV